MKHVVKAMLLGLVFAALSLGAHAIERTQTIDLSSGTAVFGDSFGKLASGNSFLSNFLFDADANSDFTGSVLSIATGAKKDLSFSGFDLYTSSDSLVAKGASNLAGTIDVWSLIISNLVADSYRLAVSGTVLGTDGGSFGGIINVSAVAEPEAWGMMIVGLAVVGFIARRRKTSVGPNFAAA